MKKIITMLLVLSMLIGIVPTYGMDTKDEPSAWAQELVDYAIGKGYVPTRLQSDYRAPITREEFAELFVTAIFAEVGAGYSMANAQVKRFMGFEELDVDLFLSKVSTTESFKDTNSKYVKAANIMGIVNGVGNGEFNPNGLITREQASIMFVNYFQTLTMPAGADAEEELADLDTASDWARDAVVWAYNATFLNGTKSPTVNGYEFNKDGLFSPKETFTREQAIMVVARLEKDRDLLDTIVLRGYMAIGDEALTTTIEVEGDTVKINYSGWDYKYSGMKEYLRTQTRFKDYTEKYTSEQINSVVISPRGSSYKDEWSNEYWDDVLEGNNILIDYGVFTVEQNAEDYLIIIEKKGWDGYLLNGAGNLVVTDDDGNQSIVVGERIK